MLATPTQSTAKHPSLTPISPKFSSSPPRPPRLHSSPHHAYEPLIPSPLSPRSVGRRASRGFSVGTQQQQQQQQRRQWQAQRYQHQQQRQQRHSMSSPPRRLSQDWNTIWDRREGDEYEERPMVGMGGDSSHRYGRGNGDGSKATGCGRLEISTSAEFLPSPSPSPSPLSSPLSRSSSLAFPWGAMGGLTSVTEEAGSVAEGFGFMATATAAAAEAGTAQPQRVHRPNPLLRGRDAVAKRRRDMFLNKVRLGRDERRWGDRGEQILRLDFVADKKRWEAELARTAPEVVPEAEYDDEVDMGGQGDVHPKYGNNDLYRHHQAGPSRHYQRPSDYGISHSHDSTRSASPFHQKSCEEQEREEAELIAQRERQELEALVALMEDEQHQPLQQVPQLGSQQGQVIGNDIDVDDDEALDGLLMGYASSKEIGGAMARGQDQGQEWDQYPDQGHTQCDEMDMSMG